MKKQKYKKIGPVSIQEICVNCGINKQRSNGRGGYQPVCSPCSKIGSATDPVGNKSRNYSFKRRYGITWEDYVERVKANDYRCEICKEQFPLPKEGERQKLHVDHNHETGELRGIVCHHCNSLLGFAKDSAERLENAIAYLTQYKPV